MSSNPFSAALRGVKKKIDRYEDGHTKRTSTNEPLTHLPIKALSRLTPEELKDYSNEQLERLENDRLQVLPGETLSRLNPNRLAQLSTKTISKLTTEALVQLPADVLAELSNHSLANAPPEVLLCAIPALHPEDLRKLKKAIHKIGHERLRQLPSDVKRRLPIPVDNDAVPPPESPQLPIQKHEISIHPLDTSKGLPPIPQSTHDFGMPTEYSESRHEQQQQQPGVVGFNAYNPAGIDPSAFSNASPPSPTHTYTGRSSPGVAKTLATCQSTAYPPKTSDHRPSYGPRRNSSVSKGSHTRARSSSRGPRQDREPKYQAYTPGQVAVAEYGPTRFSELPRDVSEMGLPTPPLRSSSRIDDLSPSEVIRRAEAWKEEHREIPRKETPKASRESIIREDTRSMSPTPPISASTSSSPEVVSFAERKRAAQGHSPHTPSANDDAGSDHTNQAIQNHTIRELKAERDRLNNQLVNARAETIALHNRLTKYIEDKSPSKIHKGDAIDVIIAYCEEICDVNTQNFNASKHWEDRYLSEKKLREETEDRLDDKSRDLRAADDNLLTLRSRLDDANQRATELETQESSLRNEISRLERDKSALERRCENQERRFENQKLQSDAAIKNIQLQHEENVAQLRQTVANHNSEMRQQEDYYKSKLHEQKEDYAQKMARQREYYDTQVKSLHQQLSDQSATHQSQLASATKELQDTISSLRSTHQQELATLRTTHQQEQNQLETTFTEQLTTLQTSHAQQLASLQKEHKADTARLNKKHARHTLDLQHKVQSLENDLVGNNDDFRPATDDSLKIQYRQLKLCIDMVTEPLNLGINGVPRNMGKLDGTRFLEREGKNQLKFLLKSVVWQRIVEGFFSEPFGIGALGNKGEGKEVLRGVVEGWRGLCGYSSDGTMANGKGSKSTTDTDLLTPFFQSREANKWRSATFQSILMAVAPPSSSMSGNKSNSRKGQQQAPSPRGTPSPPDNHISTPYWANINAVQSQIVALLSSICSEPLSPEIQSKVSELARQAGELALQFGAQRAQLGLEVPKRGEQVKIGTESGWVDCEDGDSFGGRRGVEVEVDLCVSPKVYRVGDMDGRNMDRKTAKVKAIVAGEVYPRRS